MQEKIIRSRTIKITDSEQSGFYVDNGLTPINIYRSYGMWVWEFNKDEQNKVVYKKWCDIRKERIVSKYKAKYKKEI